jgi:hypothetical protein
MFSTSNLSARRSEKTVVKPRMIERTKMAPRVITGVRRSQKSNGVIVLSFPEALMRDESV